MRTTLFLIAGLLLMASSLIVAKLFSEHYPPVPHWVVGCSVALWLAVTTTNLWVGASKAGYSVAEELPILLLLFGVPVAAAILLRWRLL